MAAGMAYLRSSVIDLARAPVSGAGPGFESPRLDYRKSSTLLHPYLLGLTRAMGRRPWPTRRRLPFGLAVRERPVMGWRA